MNNAVYCRGDSTIYYDPVFLAAVQKVVASETTSTGDYGVLVSIAHELGHAIAYRRYPDYVLGSTYGVESYADCAAGALTADAQQAGIWPVGAEKQGRAALELLSDEKFSPDGHGTAADRVQNFNQGYQNGKGSLGLCRFDGPMERLKSFGTAK
jgi:predicted metalloprotease